MSSPGSHVRRIRWVPAIRQEPNAKFARSTSSVGRRVIVFVLKGQTGSHQCGVSSNTINNGQLKEKLRNRNSKIARVHIKNIPLGLLDIHLLIYKKLEEPITK